MKQVLVAGVGMIPFKKPGDSLPYHEMGAQAARQLRGAAEGTQVAGARIALQHNLGLGGAAVVTAYGQV